MSVTTKGRKVLVFGAVVASSLMISACGGGSGGGTSSSITYTGVTTVAVIDESSAPLLADTAISSASTDPSAALGFVGAQAAGDISPVEQLRNVADLAKRLAVTPQGTQALTGAAYSGDPLPACSGSATASGSYDDATGMPYNMTVSFNNYVEDYYGDGSYCGSAVLNGSMSVTLSYDSTQQINGMSFTLSNFSVTDLATGRNQAFNGTMSMTMNNTTYEARFSMTMDFRDIDGVVYRAQNYTLDINGFGELISISGRLYDPAYGYIDLSTPTLFGYNGCIGGYPFSGVLRIDGANGGYVEINADTGTCDTYSLIWSDGVATGTSVGYWY